MASLPPSAPAPRRWLRRSLWALGGLVALTIVAAGSGLALAEWRMQRQVDVPRRALDLAAGDVERGRYLFASRGCVECHGADGAGRRFVDEPNGLRLAGPNIGPGPGSVVARYENADWERTLRHGVKPSGRPVMIMPSEDYNRLTDADLAALVAYVRQLPPAAGGAAVLELPPPVRVLYGFGLLKDAAAKIDHGLPPERPVPPGITLEHGRYVAQMCIGCHGADLAGGRIPGAPPDWPPAARLRPGAGSAIAHYPDAAALQAMFRSGQAPDGRRLRVMPFESLRAISDLDVQALHLYLKTLPAG